MMESEILKCNDQTMAVDSNEISSLETDKLDEEPSAFRRRESLAQLTTNVLAPYMPDVLKNNEYSGKVYSCSSCGDCYLSEFSLDYHLNRKSVLIKFNCESCSEKQIFYNRCCLLMHISSHVDKGESSSISNAILYPIPQVILTGVKNDIIKTLLNEVNEELIEDVEYQTPSKLLEVSMSEVEEQEPMQCDDETVKNSEDISVVEQSRPNDEFEKPIACSECKDRFYDVAERMQHFINNSILDLEYICSYCQKILPSKCAFAAHKRLHQQISPYICPECGDNSNRFWDSFQKHLKYECLHNSRVVGYKCELCSMFYQTKFNLQRHAFAKHMSILLKCKLCPMAFKNSRQYTYHKNRFHNNSKNSEDPTFLTIYSCCRKNCGISFLEQQPALDHSNNHIEDSFYGFLFKCTECDLPFDTKEVLHKHIQLHHSKIYMQYIKKFSAPLRDTGDKDQFLNSKVECLLCHCTFSKSTDYTSHMHRSHGYGKQPCSICQVTLKLRAEKIIHAKNHLRNNVPICLLCYKRPTNREPLSLHLQNHVNEIKYRTLCVICGKCLLNAKDAFLHLMSEHYLKSSVEIQSPNVSSSGNENKSEEVKQNSSESISKSSGINVISSLPTSLFPFSKPKQKLKTQVEPKPKKKCETGHCFKCDFVSTDRIKFKEHIASHKESASSFQCMDCGECYCVEPSLRLHLLVDHGITNADKYIAMEGTNHTPEKEIIPETPQTNDLECRVCYKIFTSDALLKAHLRSHGMAFIQANKGSAT